MNRLIVLALTAALAASADQAQAVGVSPSQEALLDMSDVTTVFGGTQQSTIDNIVAASGGIGLSINYVDTGENFSRVVLQKENFNADLSAFDSFDLQFQAFAQDIGVKPFIQTGDGFQFFETAFTSIAVADGPTTVSLDFLGGALPGIDNVRQFGFQIFGPNPGGDDDGVIGQGTVIVTPAPGSAIFTDIPEPTTAAICAMACLASLGVRRRS